MLYNHILHTLYYHIYNILYTIYNIYLCVCKNEYRVYWALKHFFFKTTFLLVFGAKTAYKNANTVYLEVKSFLFICVNCKN